MNPQTLAVLAGVVRFIEESEEADKTAAPAPGTSSAASAASGASLWALHGRQSIMRMRALVQQRLLKR
jgi:hypothetical protein